MNNIFSKLHILQNIDKQIITLWLPGHEEIEQSTTADLCAEQVTKRNILDSETSGAEKALQGS